MSQNTYISRNFRSWI